MTNRPWSSLLSVRGKPLESNFPIISYSVFLSFFTRDWLVISDTACWILLAIFELVVCLSFVCATVRRWQDLDIRIPANESLRELIQRPRFWAVLASAEGSTEKNQYGPAPADNPKSLLAEGELSQDIHKKLFVDMDGIEELK